MTSETIAPSPNPIGLIPSQPFPPLPDPIPPLPQPFPSLPQPFPSLPQPVPSLPQPFPPFHIRSLRCGCYLLNYAPTSSLLVSYDGTMRVECHSSGRTASGDLYQRPLIILPPLPHIPPIPSVPLLGAAPNPAAGIPIFARNRYRYYLRVTQILESFTFANTFTLGFEMHRFNPTTNVWNNEGTFTAQMLWQAAPPSYPSGSDYLTGDVKNSAGTTVGKLTMGWVSSYLRKATVEIDRSPTSEAPLDNGAGIDWRAVFDEVGWDVTVVNSNNDVAEPSGESWSNAEMHAAMLARRDVSNLDTQWRYHVLCVRRLDETERGIMYDSDATDSNNVPREGIGIASHWTIPNTPQWGLVQGMRSGAAIKPYFRTAVHEIGHAMGLRHNTIDMGFMNTTDVISASATLPVQFPNNIKWSHAPDDQKRLRHMPDIFVRPGGIPWGAAMSYPVTPISPDDTVEHVDVLELRVSALLEAVPIGAPVRVEIELVNTSSQPTIVPDSLSLKDGFVRGSVIDPSGAIRTFSSLLNCIEQHELQILDPGQSVTNSLTLLRGGQGALFPAPGMYRISVEVHWEVNGIEYNVTSEANIMVTSVVDADHAHAALKVLSTPDTLLTLVLGGDHLTDGIEAIHTALKNPVLRPHFSYIEAKRVAQRFGKRKPNMKAAAALLDDTTVMSPAEIKKAAQLVTADKVDTASKQDIAKTLKRKTSDMDVGDEVKDLVTAL